MFNTIEEGLAAFKSGNPILLIDDESRENEGDIIFPADAATQEKLNLCATHAKGLVCIAIDTNRFYQAWTFISSSSKNKWRIGKAGSYRSSG